VTSCPRFPRPIRLPQQIGLRGVSAIPLEDHGQRRRVLAPTSMPDPFCSGAARKSPANAQGLGQKDRSSSNLIQKSAFLKSPLNTLPLHADFI
jgi:hypothetical protein